MFLQGTGQVILYEPKELLALLGHSGSMLALDCNCPKRLAVSLIRLAAVKDNNCYSDPALAVCEGQIILLNEISYQAVLADSCFPLHKLAFIRSVEI